MRIPLDISSGRSKGWPIGSKSTVDSLVQKSMMMYNDWPLATGQSGIVNDTDVKGNTMVDRIIYILLLYTCLENQCPSYYLYNH